MSQEYIVLIVSCERGARSIDGAKAEVFMRFTEAPPSEFLSRLASENPGKRVYCLMGASSWHEEECKHDWRHVSGYSDPSAQPYECILCGETEERDVS